MSRIRSHGNRGTELRLATWLRKSKITGWRRRQKLFGKPDFVFRKARLAVFVDGCFWHVCPKHATLPAGNRAFWKRKLSANQRRDKLVARTLRAQGWRVLRIWEHDLAAGRMPKTLERITRSLERQRAARNTARRSRNQIFGAR